MKIAAFHNGSIGDGMCYGLRRCEGGFHWSKREFPFVPEAFASLTKKLGLLQTVGKDAAQQWARRTRELQAQCPLDQAAIKAASEIFPSEFRPTRYDYSPPPIAEVLVAIEAL